MSVCVYLWSDGAREASPLPKGLSGVDGVEVGFTQAGLCEEAHGRTLGQGKPIHPRSHGEGRALSDGPLWVRLREHQLHGWCPHATTGAWSDGLGISTGWNMRSSSTVASSRNR